MDLKNAVEKEVYGGLIPGLKGDRIYNFSDMFLVCAGLGVATWCYVQGGYLSTMLNLKEIFFNSIFAVTLGSAIVFFAVLIATRFGIDLAVYMRALFGYRGIVVLTIGLYLFTWGFQAVNCQMFGSSIPNC